jgi:hypothetical protein
MYLSWYGDNWCTEVVEIGSLCPETQASKTLHVHEREASMAGETWSEGTGHATEVQCCELYQFAEFC